MSDGQTIILRSSRARAQAKGLIALAPDGAIVNIRESKRTIDQNALMWALLSDVSRAKPQGRVLRPDIWKCIFMAAVGHHCRFEPSLDGDGVVPIGFRSSRLSKSEMSDMIEAILAFGAEHDITWSNDERQAA